MLNTNQNNEEKNKTLEHMEYVQNAKEADTGGRVIPITTLIQEILEAGIDSKDVLMTLEITGLFDIRNYFTCAFRVFRWANWLVVVRKREEDETITLPADAEPLMVKDASITAPDGVQLFELHLSTSSLEANVTSEGVKVLHSFKDEGAKMVKDASITKPLTSVVIHIMAVRQGQDDSSVTYSKIEYTFPQEA
jgi:hypothetical protein